MIQFERISKRYKTKQVLNEVTFTIKSGSLVAVIGESGCGKTTLLKMINCLIKPTSGMISIDGKSINSMDEVALRRSIGYVIQQTGLFPHMTVKENIELIPKLEKELQQTLKKIRNS